MTLCLLIEIEITLIQKIHLMTTYYDGYILPVIISEAVAQ